MSGKVVVIKDLLYTRVSGILMVSHNLLTGICEVLSSPLLFLYGSLSINVVIYFSCSRSKEIISLFNFYQVFEVVSIVIS